MNKLITLLLIIAIAIIIVRLLRRFNVAKTSTSLKQTSLADKPWPTFPENEDFLDRECYVYEEETLDDFTKRYDGFGKEVYNHLIACNPKILSHLKFYNISAATGKCGGEPDFNASFAVYYDSMPKFMIDLDHYATITISNYKFSREFGDWSDTAVEDAVAFVENMILSNE